MTIQLILLGIALILFLGVKAIFERLHTSPIIGYLLLGWVLRLAGEQFPIPIDMQAILSVLANIGIIFLLFHVGLETHLKQLLRFLTQAGFIAFCNILLSGVFGFLTSWFYGLSIKTSLFIGVAFTATSIGVSTASWKPKKLTRTKPGIILLDLVTIDDIVGIILMALLFSLIPKGSIDGSHIFQEFGYFLLKLGFFVTFCYVFSHHGEPWIMKKLIKYEKMPDSMLTIFGIGLIIAGVAALIHFSLAIGAFFAGIAFSRDPRAVKMEASTQSILDFFVPFFFFWIGYQTSISSIYGHWPLFAILFLVAIAGKFIGTYFPARWIGIGKVGALLIAASTIPRAEISMVIIEHGLQLGAISEEIYSIMALIALFTCALTPLLIKKIRLHTISH